MNSDIPLIETLEALALRPARDLSVSKDRLLRRLHEALEVQRSPAVFRLPGSGPSGEEAGPEASPDGRTIRGTASRGASCRPSDSQGRPGGLVILNPEYPALILPDLHTRRGELFQILSRPWEKSGETVLQSLEKERLNLVCVGDALHSEGPGAQARWQAAWEEYLRDFSPSPEMDREMNAGLALVEMIILLQARFPRNFFFLKGNHENIACEDGRGNHPFGKYAAEGEMVFGYLEHRMGKNLVKELYRWEHSLPLMAQGPWYLISHAEPRRAFSPEEVIDAARRPEVIEGITWTRRWEAEPLAAPQTLGRFFSPWLSARTLYWAGHTPVDEPVRYRKENLVLFHGSGPLRGWILPAEVPDLSAAAHGSPESSAKKKRMKTLALRGAEFFRKAPDSQGLEKFFQAVSADEGSGF